MNELFSRTSCAAPELHSRVSGDGKDATPSVTRSGCFSLRSAVSDARLWLGPSADGRPGEYFNRGGPPRHTSDSYRRQRDHLANRIAFEGRWWIPPRRKSSLSRGRPRRGLNLLHATSPVNGG